MAPASGTRSRLGGGAAAAPPTVSVHTIFALETCCPANDRLSAARIEEVAVVTQDGAWALTSFPAPDLMVINPY